MGDKPKINNKKKIVLLIFAFLVAKYIIPQSIVSEKTKNNQFNFKIIVCLNFLARAKLFPLGKAKVPKLI